MNFWKNQNGGGLLAIVAVLGAVMVMVQGTLYYRAQGSAKFIAGEKNKILAQQMAESGVEDNIGEIGSRKIKITGPVTGLTTFDHKTLGPGSYTSMLTTVALGALADTIDLVSIGTVGHTQEQVQARLKLKKYIDTVRTPRILVTPETTLVFGFHVKFDTTKTTSIKDPETMPIVNTTPAYAACMSSSAKKCDVCHLPSGDLSKANVINIAKAAISTHISHHGDYVTTDGTCDMYKPKSVTVITSSTVFDTTLTVKDKTTYDTTISMDTAVKVQFLSWK